MAVHQDGNWKTVRYPQYTTKCLSRLSIAILPVGIDGRAYFVGWDIDGGPQGVQAILAALPKECKPLVSASGKKGWHVWVFPDRPLSVQTAIRFAKSVREMAGVSCEVFPSSRRSRCLKWPSSIHPETGVQEVFVPLDDLNDTDRLDTPAILELLAEGYYRTPAEVIENFVLDTGPPTVDRNCKQLNAIDSKCNQVQAVECTRLQVGEASRCVPDGTNFATLPEVAFGLAALAGRRVNRIGQAFRCILPGHRERRPSAAFCYGDNGTIVYHDLHHAKHGTPEILTLGEAYAAVVTGEIRKLRPVDGSRWLCRLALRVGFRNQKAAFAEERLKALTPILHSIHGGSKKRAPQKAGAIYSPVGCKANAPVGCKARKDEASRDSVLEKVWQVFCEEAMLSAMAGFEEVKLSKRFLAERAGIPGDMANRAINLLAVLGFIEKVPGSGGERGDRFILGAVSEEEARRRLNALFPGGKVDLRALNRRLVAAKLGEELAARVFRRQAETVKGTVTQTVSETVTQTVNRAAEIERAAATNPWLRAIWEADKEGDSERVKRLLREYNAVILSRKRGCADTVPVLYLYCTDTVPVPC